MDFVRSARPMGMRKGPERCALISADTTLRHHEAEFAAYCLSIGVRRATVWRSRSLRRRCGGPAPRNSPKPQALLGTNRHRELREMLRLPARTGQAVAAGCGLGLQISCDPHTETSRGNDLHGPYAGYGATKGLFGVFSLKQRGRQLIAAQFLLQSHVGEQAYTVGKRGWLFWFLEPTSVGIADQRLQAVDALFGFLAAKVLGGRSRLRSFDTWSSCSCQSRRRRQLLAGRGSVSSRIFIESCAENCRGVRTGTGGQEQTRRQDQAQEDRLEPIW
jgi:hypothetical protein